MGFLPWVAVGGGAVLGAWLRWGLGAWLNPLFPTVPLGTLAANLLGGLLIGLALGFFSHFQALAPEWRLAIITGFLGALTTFSTFSAEAVTLLLRRQYAWFAGDVLLHVVGALAMTLVGIGLIRVLTRA